MDKIEVDVLCRQLRTHGGGANAHSANKAGMYLEIFLRDNKTQKLEELARSAQMALATGDWKQLHSHMGGWW